MEEEGWRPRNVGRILQNLNQDRLRTLVTGGPSIIVDSHGTVLIQVSANQDLEHAPYGGIVPEIASRNHSIALLPLIQLCLDRSQLSWTDIHGLSVRIRLIRVIGGLFLLQSMILFSIRSNPFNVTT